MRTDSNVWKFERSILISDEIDSASIASSLAKLISLIDDDNTKDEKEKAYERKPIKIYINTHGGSVYDGLALIDIIINSKTPIYTYAIGKCFSMGFEIFCVGHKRFIGKHATLLWHSISGGLYGCIKTLDEGMEQSHKLQKIIENIVTDKTKITQEKLEEIKNIKLDWYIDAIEAKELGIADYFLEEEKDIAIDKL